MKAITLCADDFSLNPAINAGILALLEQQRLTAVSCMTQSASWPVDARALLPFRAQAGIGVHINFTHPFPEVPCYELPELMWLATMRWLDEDLLRHSVRDQLDHFEHAMGSAPDFIDGHQHVHVFPVIRDIVVDEVVSRYGSLPQKPWLRSLASLPADGRQLKAIALRLMGTKAQEALLALHHLPHNNGFAGLYNLEPQANLDDMMRHWLGSLPGGGLLMCHPAQETVDDDPISAARVAEYQYLSSDGFKRALQDCNVQLVR